MKYAWIKEHRDEYSVVRLCHAMQVSKSGFYSWLNSEPSPRRKRTDSIRKAVRDTSEAFQKIMRTTNITCSMSRTGCCYDNAVVERFFWSLKHEWTKFKEFENLDEARLSVFKYIETFYNSKRIHQTLDYQTPNEVERKYRAALAA